MQGAMATPEWADERLSVDLVVLRSQGESQKLEFIERFPDQVRDLGKEIAAFATSNAGTILLGVSDSGDLVGLLEAETAVGRDTLLRRLEGICRGTVKPAMTPVARFAVEDGKVVLVMQVPKGRQPVYYCGSIPYLRHLTESRPAEPHEVIELISDYVPQIAVSSDDARASSRRQLYYVLAGIVVDVLICADEASERLVSPWLDMWRSEFEYSATGLRELAVQDMAIEEGISAELSAFAEMLDQVAKLHMVIGSGPELLDLVRRVRDEALRFKKERVERANVIEESLNELREAVVVTSRKVRNLVERARGLLESGDTERVQLEAASLGRILLGYSYRGAEVFGDEVAIDMREIGRDLHLLETKRLYMDGGQSQQEVYGRLSQANKNLELLLSRLPEEG